MKDKVRHIAIASGPKGKKKRTILVGIIFRDDYVEGVLSTNIGVDGTDSTYRIIKMIEKSRFGDQIKILVFNGIALAGLNVIDPDLLERKLNAKVVVLSKRRQRPDQLVFALQRFSKKTKSDTRKRVEIVREYAAIKPIKLDDVFVQSRLERHYAARFAKRAFESLRMAHIVASGISTGESRGRL